MAVYGAHSRQFTGHLTTNNILHPSSSLQATNTSENSQGVQTPTPVTAQSDDSRPGNQPFISHLAPRRGTVNEDGTRSVDQQVSHLAQANVGRALVSDEGRYGNPQVSHTYNK